LTCFRVFFFPHPRRRVFARHSAECQARPAQTGIPGLSCQAPRSYDEPPYHRILAGNREARHGACVTFVTSPAFHTLPRASREFLRRGICANFADAY
jgi:hypothetical protein